MAEQERIEDRQVDETDKPQHPPLRSQHESLPRVEPVPGRQVSVRLQKDSHEPETPKRCDTLVDQGAADPAPTERRLDVQVY